MAPLTRPPCVSLKPLASGTHPRYANGRTRQKAHRCSLMPLQQPPAAPGTRSPLTRRQRQAQPARREHDRAPRPPRRTHPRIPSRGMNTVLKPSPQRPRRSSL